MGEKIPLFLRTDRILFRGTVDDDAKKIRSERLIQKPETTVAALGQGNARLFSNRIGIWVGKSLIWFINPPGKFGAYLRFSSS